MKLQVENRLEKFPYSLGHSSNLFRTKTKLMQDIKGNDILRRKKITVLGGGDYHSFNMFQKPVHVKDLGACYQFF